MPIYEYLCPDHGPFVVLWKKMPRKVPQVEACWRPAYRAAPEGRRMAKCYKISPLTVQRSSHTRER